MQEWLMFAAVMVLIGINVIDMGVQSRKGKS